MLMSLLATVLESFVAQGDFWRHPEDPRDFSVQPPTRPVDEFVLKFQKPM
jgi:hypothetical protein